MDAGVYPAEDAGAIEWLLGEDGRRYRLTEPFPTTLSVRDTRHLVAIRDQLSALTPSPRMAFVQRRIEYFNAKIPFPIRYSAARNIFPVANCEREIDENLVIQTLNALDDRWDHKYKLPPLRLLHIEPDCDPQYTSPTLLKIMADKYSRKIPLLNAFPSSL